MLNSQTRHATTPGYIQLSVYHCNANSANKQKDRLSALAEYDVIGITETWLTDRVADAEIQALFPNHTLYRRDRGSRGGGVMCAVRSTLLPVRLGDPADVEVLLIHLDKLSVTVAVCYRPPKNADALTTIMKALNNLHGPLVIVGDFNIPKIAWKRTGNAAASPTSTPRKGKVKAFLEQCGKMKLHQWVDEPTRGANTLDLVLTRHLDCNRVQVVGERQHLRTDHKETIAWFNVKMAQTDANRNKCFLNTACCAYD